MQEMRDEIIESYAGTKLLIQATFWEKHGHRRLYFSSKDSTGQAVWDCKNRQWLKCHKEWGHLIKANLVDAFDLNCDDHEDGRWPEQNLS